MSLQLWLMSLAIRNQRKEMFNQDFMEKHFGKTHKDQIHEDIQMGGFPDTGNGFYSQKLSYS
jgi:hypothetical protein